MMVPLSLGRKLIVRSWPARKNSSHNPFQMLLADGIEFVAPDILVQEFLPKNPLQRSDVWHWHWPDGLLSGSLPSATVRLIYTIVLLCVARFKKIAIVWTAHNVASHMGRHPSLERVLFRVFTRHVDGVHYLSESSYKHAISVWPQLKSKPNVITRHGVYPVVEPKVSPRLPNGKFVVAFVGKISPYKGITDFLDAYDGISQADVHLLVAGELNPALVDWAARRRAGSAQETWVTGLLTDAEIAGAYEVADLVVLPYRAVTNSGSLMYALSAGKRVLAPAIGSIPEVAAEVGGQWVLTYLGVINTEILDTAIDRVRRSSTNDIGPDLTAFQWNIVAAEVAGLYQRVCKKADR